MRFPCMLVFAVWATSPVASSQGLLYSAGFGGQLSHYGSGSAVVGDVDGDGLSDFVISRGSSPFEKHLIEVFSGRDGTLVLSFEVDDYLDNIVTQRALAAAGDVDNDGGLDVLSGRSLVDWGGSVHVFSLANGAVIRKHDTDEKRFGWHVSGAVDLDQDGFDDYLVAAGARAVALSGSSGAELHQMDGDFFPFANVEGLGDVDGDGADDWAVSSSGVAVRGRVRVVSGQSGDVLYELTGQSDGQRFGTSLGRAPDIDGDLRPDFVIGSPFSIGKAGAHVVVVSGATGEALRVLSGRAENDGFGWSSCGVGDLDGDGWSEIAVGARSDSIGGYLAGRVAVFSGSTGEVVFSRLGQTPGGNLGVAVGALGDVDGDGVSDLLASRSNIGAPPFLRAFSGGAGDMLIGTGIEGVIAPATAVKADIDEAFFPGVAGQKLGLTMQTLSGNLKPRIAIVDAAGEILKQLSFTGKAASQTKKYTLKETGMFRLRVRGLKTASKAHSSGEYRVSTASTFKKNAGEQSLVRKGKPGTTLAVKVDALSGAVLDGVVSPLKYEGSMPVPELESPAGELLDLTSYASLGPDGAIFLTSVPLSQLGRYRLLVPAAAGGKSKVRFEIVPTQPIGTGVIAGD